MIGPLLFTAYFDGVTSDDANTTCVKYSDDLLCMRPTNDADEFSQMQQSVDLIVQRMTERSLKPNASKCCQIAISESTMPFASDQSIMIFGQNVETVNSMPYLGVMIDEKLKWDIHTEVQVTKAKKAIRHLKRVGDKQ